jgi:hypothetical protein
MTFSTAALVVIKTSPFIAAAFVAAMAMRAILKGELKSGGGRSCIRTIIRSSNPIQFWIEIGLYGVVATFFVLFGLLFCDHAPDWFRDLVIHRPRHALFPLHGTES